MENNIKERIYHLESAILAITEYSFYSGADFTPEVNELILIIEELKTGLNQLSSSTK